MPDSSLISSRLRPPPVPCGFPWRDSWFLGRTGYVRGGIDCRETMPVSLTTDSGGFPLFAKIV